MFGDRAKKSHYLDKNGKRTTDISQARVMTKTVQPYKTPEYEAIFWWTDSTEMRIDLNKSNTCGYGICTFPDTSDWTCWLQIHPRKCLYRHRKHLTWVKY